MREDNCILLHSDVYLPNWVINKAMRVQAIKKNYKCSWHFKTDHSKLNRDLKHLIDEEELLALAKKLEDSPLEPFEVELTYNNYSKRYDVTKQVVRLPLNENTDVAIVFRFDTIVTAWLNNKLDKHYTLNEAKYARRIN